MRRHVARCTTEEEQMTEIVCSTTAVQTHKASVGGSNLRLAWKIPRGELMYKSAWGKVTNGQTPEAALSRRGAGS